MASDVEVNSAEAEVELPLSLGAVPVERIAEPDVKWVDVPGAEAELLITDVEISVGERTVRLRVADVEFETEAESDVEIVLDPVCDASVTGEDNAAVSAVSVGLELSESVVELASDVETRADCVSVPRVGKELLKELAPELVEAAVTVAVVLFADDGPPVAVTGSTVADDSPGGG